MHIVHKGDTLRKIAAKYGMTLDELIRKNPQIKNIDKISIGDRIIHIITKQYSPGLKCAIKV